MNKTNILFSIDCLRRGGKERQLMLLYSKLSEEKYIKYLIVRDLTGKNYLQEYYIEANKIIAYNGFSDFYKIIVKIKPGIVFTWDIRSTFFSILLLTIRKYKIINGSIRHGIRLFRFSHILRSILCHLSHYVIANSLAGLKANNLKPGGKIFVVYNGIEEKFLNCTSKKTTILKRKAIIPNYETNPGNVFITVAGLVPYKDHFGVLNAFRELKRIRNFYYLIIGDGPLRPNIESIIRKYGLEKNVILFGSIENVSDYLFISDIMIHSSRGEGISNAILEGMYAGLPIIATNVGGIPETVYPGSSMLFPYKDDKALLDCLLKAPEVFASFNPESEDYKKHLQKFSVETMLHRFEEIIKTVIESS